MLMEIAAASCCHYPSEISRDLSRLHPSQLSVASMISIDSWCLEATTAQSG
jgi:hypothetical protein